MKEVKRQAKKGEYIKIIKPKYSFSRIGDILKVHKANGSLVLVLEKDHPKRNDELEFSGKDEYLWSYLSSEYVVLEGYRKEESMRKFTRKDLKVGDIATFKDGSKNILLRDETGKLSLFDGKNGRYAELDKYKNNLEIDYSDRGLDIMKVERCTQLSENLRHCFNLKGNRKTLITVFERKEEILDEAEKRYLRGVIRPFRDKIIWIEKTNFGACEYLHINFEDTIMDFPNFKKGTMYKGMKLNKEYTLEELGL